MAAIALDKKDILEVAEQRLGVEALETVPLPELNETAPKAPKKLPSAPACITQRPVPQNLLQGEKNYAALMVGTGYEVPRWAPGSVVKWTAWRQGYDSQDDADYAAVQLDLAAQKWNAADIGVTFEFVPLARDANFVVCHGGDLGGVLASAYFPNRNDLNFVYVYTRAFDPDWKPSLWKVLTHELGHVLGLRHEFARSEGGAVAIDQPNEFSVMNYRVEPPEIQQSDIDSTRKFYQMKQNTFIEGTPIHDYTPR